MEFVKREVKRSKKKKRLHAFPPDKPDVQPKKGVLQLHGERLSFLGPENNK